MPEKIITSLNNNVVFVEYFYVKDQIILQLFAHNATSKIESLSCEIINSNIPYGIPNNEKV